MTVLEYQLPMTALGLLIPQGTDHLDCKLCVNVPKESVEA